MKKWLLLPALPLCAAVAFLYWRTGASQSPSHLVIPESIPNEAAPTTRIIPIPPEPAQTATSGSQPPFPKGYDPAVREQQRAVARYPDLAKAGSKMHRDFLAAVDIAKKRDPNLLRRSDWPLVIAAQVAPATPAPPEAADSYGERPNTDVGLLPPAARHAIQQSLRDPESFKVHQVGPPSKAEYQGRKCWAFSVLYGARNGSGGYEDAGAMCYMRGSTLVGFESVK